MDTDRKPLFIVTGIVLALFVIAVIVTTVCVCLPKWLEIVLNIIMALTASGIAGLLVALLVDMPQLVRNFQDTLTNALGSNEYLEELPKEKLDVLRAQTVHALHKKSPRVPSSFLQLDDELCGLISAPYYDYLNESIVVGHKGKYADLLKLDGENQPEVSAVEGDFLKKDVLLEYSIKNPGQGTDAEAKIGLRKYLDLPEGCDIESSYVFKFFEVTIDDDETHDICQALIVERCKVLSGRVGSDPNTMTYDTIVRTSIRNDIILDKESIKKLEIAKGVEYTNKDIDSKHDITVRFKDSVRVRVAYKQIFPVADSHYTRRLKYSAKHYMLSYTCEDEFKLHGQIIGTLIKQSDMSIIKNNDNNLTMICRSWLLPKNGAFIVMDDIVK